MPIPRIPTTTPSRILTPSLLFVAPAIRCVSPWSVVKLNIIDERSAWPKSIRGGGAGKRAGLRRSAAMPRRNNGVTLKRFWVMTHYPKEKVCTDLAVEVRTTVIFKLSVSSRLPVPIGGTMAQSQTPVKGSDRVPLPGARAIGAAHGEQWVEVTVKVKRKAELPDLAGRPKTKMTREELAAKYGANAQDVEKLAEQFRAMVWT